MEQTSGIDVIGVVYISTNPFRSSRCGGNRVATLIMAAIAAETAIKIQFSCSWYKKIRHDTQSTHNFQPVPLYSAKSALVNLHFFRINKKELMVCSMLWTRFFPLQSFFSLFLFGGCFLVGEYKGTTDSWSFRRIFIHFCYKRACESNYMVQYW